MDYAQGTNAQSMARIDEAIEELAGFPLPPVWIGEPDYDEDGNLVGPKLTYYQLEQHGLVEKVAGHALPGHCQMELWEQTVHVLAARQGLVTIRKILPGDKATDTENLMIASISDPSCRIEEGYYHGVVGSLGPKPRSEEWVEESTVVVFDFPPDEHVSYPSTIFYRFVARDTLDPGDIPFTEDFCVRAECGPSGGYSIPASTVAKMVWRALSNAD